MRDIFALEDGEGNMVIYFRRMMLNGRMYKMRFPDTPPPDGSALAAELAKAYPDENRFFEIVHHIYPRDDYEKDSLTKQRMPFASDYIDVESQKYIGDEDGFLSPLYNMPRAETEAGEIYAYAPSMVASGALGGVNAVKKSLTKLAHVAADPTVLANDDGLLSGRIDLRPGRVIWGGLDNQGRQLVKSLERGTKFNVAEEMIENERKDIKEAFFADMFDILLETDEMKATQVMDRIAKETALLAPVMGRLQVEDLGPSIEREVTLLAEQGYIVMPGRRGRSGALEMPPELIEAQGDYKITYTSPLSKSLSMDEVTAYFRLQDQLAARVQITQDPATLDWLKAGEHRAIPEIADTLGVPTRWIASPEEMAQQQQSREQQQAEAAMVQSAPALASVATSAMKQGSEGQAPPTPV